MFDPWKRTRALRQLRARLTKASGRLVDALCADLRQPRRHVRDHELATALDLLGRFRMDAVSPVHPALRLGERGPVGAVALLIGPRAPLITLARGLGAAFVAGNIEVAVGVSEELPRLVQVLTDIVQGVLPGVRVLSVRPDDWVERCLADPYLRVLLATGASSWMAARRAVVRRSYTRVVFEGDGNDALIVWPGADLDAAARVAVGGFALSAAQDPAAVQRVYVHDAVHDALVERIVGLAGELHGGSLASEETTLGSIPTATIVRAQQLIDEASAAGARVRCGAEVKHHSDGSTLSPTVLTGCAPDARVVMESAPVLPVVRVCDADALLRAVTTVVGEDELAALHPGGYTASFWGGSDPIWRDLCRRFGHVVRDADAARQPALRLDWGGYGATSWVWGWSESRFVRLHGPRDLVVEMSRPLLR